MFTVEHTRNSSEERLYDLFKERLHKLLQSGQAYINTVNR